MSAPSVARNYAEVLYDLAGASDAQVEYGELIDAVASAINGSPEIQAVLVSHRVPKAEKSALFARALGDLPVPFFVHAGEALLPSLCHVVTSSGKWTG